ncbi:MAG: GNAT family N-acetyltransferase [Spirochaetales bacterium]|nr:GNAT family N-acetyltransferase [Spirochaetales bacterium]
MNNKKNVKPPISIYIRYLKLDDLGDFFQLNLPEREHNNFNGPYYRKQTRDELTEYVGMLRKHLLAGKIDVLDQKKIIANKDTDEIIGTVNWYWKSRETNWMEIGIVIFNEKYWGKGIGFQALSLWTTEIFKTYPELVRLGMMTWSGNKRMMALAEKLGFQKEAVYRKARIVNDEYYDSVSYGILKEEWFKD